MEKDIYTSMFRALKSQNEICSALENIGLNFEYGIGRIGEAFESINNHCFLALKSSLNFSEILQCRNVDINGVVTPAQFSVYYVGDYDEDFTITEDDFSEFVFYAINHLKLQDLFWRAMVEKDEDAREQFNMASSNFQISNYWKGD